MQKAPPTDGRAFLVIGIHLIPESSIAKDSASAGLYGNRKERRDRTRRRRWYTSVHKSSVSRGCRAWLMCLAERSSDTAKPVWGNQLKQAREIGCTDRMVRNYRKEAEEAKLIETVRAEPEQDAQGRWSRARTNIYRFCVPPAIRKTKKANPNRPEIYFPSNHLSTRDIDNLTNDICNYPQEEVVAPWSAPPPEGFKAMRALIGR